MVGSLLVAIALLLGGRGAPPDPCERDCTRFVYRQIHMGMEVRVVLYTSEEVQAERAARAAFDTIATLDSVLSHYRSDSELMRLIRHAGEAPVAVGEHLFRVLKHAETLSRRSGGAFDVTVGPYVALWREAHRNGTLPTASSLQQADSLVGWTMIDLNETRRTVQLARAGMQLDLGGVAKGYVLDRAREALAVHGVTRVLVEAGGDLVVGDPPPGRDGWRIEVPHAVSGDGEQHVETVARAAVATSGDAVQYVEIEGTRYSHVVDPRTGLGLTDHRLTTVIAPEGMTADGLATTIGMLAPAEGRRLAAVYPRATAFVAAGDSTHVFGRR